MNTTSRLSTKLQNVRFRIYYLTIFKIKTFIRRKIYRLFRFNRPTSHPYISGDGFRALAQHVYDEVSEVIHSEVMPGDIIFVRADLLINFFNNIHPKINNRYILISHNSDENIDNRFTKYIDKKIIHWFAQNVLIDHEKITPIPIGLKLRFYDRENSVVKLLQKFEKYVSKSSGIFYCFSEETNKKRSVALNILREAPTASGSSMQNDREWYYSNLSKYTHNASPEGNGIDCHRTWESLYLRTIPIVESNISTLFWKKIGLPILVIERWKDIENLDLLQLKKQYDEFEPKFNSATLYMDYWNEIISRYKNKHEI